MGGEGTTEVEDQDGGFVLLLNDNIDEINKDQFYVDILNRGIK